MQTTLIFRLGAVAIGLVAASMSWWCWGRNADLLIDFGRELYVPWQLSQGKTLYVDIAYFNGPLSPYWNAVWFAIFGPSVRCLALCNVAILAVFLGLVYQMLSAAASRPVAIFGTLVSILCFALGPTPEGNFNFLYPYSHEATHGMVLSVAAIYCFWHFVAGRNTALLIAAGLLLGLTFLTKPELALAASAALGVGLVLEGAMLASLRERMRMALVFASATLVAPLTAFGLLALQMPWEQALRGTLGGFVYLFNSELTSQNFYRELMGTAQAGQNLLRIVAWLAVYAAVVALSWLIATRVSPLKSNRWAIAACLFAAMTAVCSYFRLEVWVRGLSPLPVVVGGAAVFVGARWWTERRNAIAEPRLILELMVLAFSLVLLLKVVLNVMALWYGFTLAMPATLVLLVVLLERIPAAIERRGGSGPVFQAAWLGAIVVFVGVGLNIDRQQFAARSVAVSGGSDMLMGGPYVGEAVQGVLGDIERLVGPDQTLAVMPEGVLINYLSRRVNPTPYISLLPTELIMFGEDRVLASLKSSPPDFVVWAPRDMRSFALEGFGIDYATKIGAWLQESYRPVTDYPPGDRYQIRLLKYAPRN